MTEPYVRGALDCLCILAAFVLALRLQGEGRPFDWAYCLEYLGYYAIFGVVWCWIAIDQRLWGTHRSEELSTYLLSVFRAVAAALVLSVFVSSFVAGHRLDREFLAVFSLLAAIGVLALRLLVREAIAFLRMHGYDVERVLIIGANDRTAHLVDVIQRHPYHGYRIVGFLEDDPDRVRLLEQLNVPYLGGFESLPRILGERRIDDVFIITLPVRSQYEFILDIARTCETERVPVLLVADLFPRRVAKTDIRYMGDVPLLSLSAVPEEQAEVAIKRLMDIVGSSMMLAILAPIFIGVAIAIKLDSKGPVFFFQERVGRNQRRFKMAKFRSMVTDAEERRAELEAMNEADGPVFKIRNDPRITRLGRFIRKYSIDELPQLFNVWLGQMSLVGPRPPIPSEVEEYTWHQRRRLSVKPGMTGLWQVSGRSDVDFDQWVAFDLEYIDNWSVWFDIMILFRTVGVVLKGKGAA